MASKKQYVLIAIVTLWCAGSGAISGISGGSLGVVGGLLGGFTAGLLLSSVLVAFYNSRTEDEVLTVEDVQ